MNSSFYAQKIGLLVLLFLSSCLAGGGHGHEDEEVVCEFQGLSSYNVGFHVAGLFIILAVSVIGIAGATFLGGMLQKSSAVVTLMQFLKMFGIGIMVSTAWIHLLPDAFSQFSNPCLPEGWAEYGTAYVGLFAMIASFFVQALEFYISGQTGFSHSHEITPNHVVQTPENEKNNNQTADTVVVSDVMLNSETTGTETAVSQNGPDYSSVAIDLNNATEIEMQQAQTQGSVVSAAVSPVSKTATDDIVYDRGVALSVALLELGILVHSFIIGMTLGLINDNQFVALLIAISFHQGLALGALISGVKFESVNHKYILCIAYPIITPLGAAIGIAIRHDFNENSPSAILSVGILGSISAGILFYNTYSELISTEINRNAGFRKLPQIIRNGSFFAMYFGAACMAILGIWA